MGPMQFPELRRRDFIALLGGAAAAWPLPARAQQPAMPVLGFIGTETADVFARRLQAFRPGLLETGYIERQNVTLADRWAQGQSDRLPALAAELVRLQVSVIVASGGVAARAAKAVTTTIPIVFWI